MKDAIAAWKQSGRVYFWTYRPQKRNFIGWHFAADAAGKDSIIDLLEVLPNADYPTKRTVKLTSPPDRVLDVPFAPRHCHKVVSPAALRFVFEPEWQEDAWQVLMDGDHAQISLGHGSMRELADAVRSARNGDFDFAIGPRREDAPQAIWFW
jgi:hypothetical protein